MEHNAELRITSICYSTPRMASFWFARSCSTWTTSAKTLKGYFYTNLGGTLTWGLVALIDRRVLDRAFDRQRVSVAMF